MIANRGEIAVRIAETAHNMGIATVAVFSEADRGALHTLVCDESVCIGAPEPSASYLNIAALIAAAQKTGANAVHPGYGFLSERADFAQAVLDAGLIWVGPSPKAISTMGSKTQARAAVEAADVPVVPGTHDIESAASIGFPLLIKAVSGGGGRGMRLVHASEELEEAIRSASDEARSAFGDPSLFAERFIEKGRHVEIQVFGDQHGQVTALYERECSVQRRHQKVIEEAPSPVLDQALREQMQDAALRAAKSVDYVGAGTVEFLLSEDGSFYFLEMNTRLQVEHPVTEAITGLDLVRLQLEVAQGASLPAIPEACGASIEVRLYAEDASADNAPQTGRVLALSCEDQEGIRLDTGVAEGSEVSVHYDPMLAKLIAHGENREDARKKLCRALEKLCLLGVKTNQDYLLHILNEPDFISGDLHTSWLETSVHLPDPVVPKEAAIAALCHQILKPKSLLPSIKKGWRNSHFDDRSIQIGSRQLRWRPAPEGWTVSTEGVEHSVTCHLQGDSLVLEVDGLRRMVQVKEDQDSFYVWVSGGAYTLTKHPRFADEDSSEETGDCQAPTPGKVTRVCVKPGDGVQSGDLLVVLEAMKMEHPICASINGTVTDICVEEGDQVSSGDLLVVLEENE